jgi:hypothetical protein
MTTWEYRLLLLMKDRELDTVQSALDDMGHHGWEMVTAYTNPDTVIFIFKKRRSKQRVRKR